MTDQTYTHPSSASTPPLGLLRRLDDVTLALLDAEPPDVPRDFADRLLRAVGALPEPAHAVPGRTYRHEGVVLLPVHHGDAARWRAWLGMPTP